MEPVNEKAAGILKRLNVLMTGHFRLTSGLHSDRYMQCAKLFENPEESAELCYDLSGRFCDVDLVAGPAIGGIIMAYEVARALGVRNIFAERENGKMTLRRGFLASPGERVLVVEDVVTTGGSVEEVIGLMRGFGAEIVGVGAIVDRSGGRASFGVPFHALVVMEATSWKEEECPLCRDGIPLTKPGSRPI
ncbi:MAG: orotate phosphoribosyltransferase [Synergistaceae bacterium]|jgi:orotate phosphoribosyltransferase|nr:orotate phosphoribosyltransferase [Synergistaceae bacterium]